MEFCELMETIKTYEEKESITLEELVNTEKTFVETLCSELLNVEVQHSRPGKESKVGKIISFVTEDRFDNFGVRVQFADEEKVFSLRGRIEKPRGTHVIVFTPRVMLFDTGQAPRATALEVKHPHRLPIAPMAFSACTGRIRLVDGLLGNMAQRFHRYRDIAPLDGSENLCLGIAIGPHVTDITSDIKIGQRGKSKTDPNTFGHHAKDDGYHNDGNGKAKTHVRAVGHVKVSHLHQIALDIG